MAKEATLLAAERLHTPQELCTTTKSASMKKATIPILISLIFSGGVFAHDIPENQEYPKDVEELLNEAISLNDFERGLAYVLQLQSRDTLSYLVLADCAECLIGLEKFRECIQFINNWVEKYPDLYSKDMFDTMYGECYYFLGESDLANSYLSHYVKWAEDNNINPGIYYLGIFAETLYDTYHYDEASMYFDKYFDTVVKNECINYEDIPSSKHRISYGYKFYDYAYTHFFLGNEKKGKILLEYSMRCGNEAAATDYSILNNCETFAEEFKIKKSTIYQWEDYIAKFDIKDFLTDISNDNPSAFWDRLEFYNVNYQNLLKALNKKKVKNSLSNAINEINSVESVVKSRLYLFNPYQVSDFEEYLKIQLLGKRSPKVDLRIYPAEEANAFATPYGQIYLTEGIVRRYHFSDELLLAVCAHEITHYLCFHSLVSLWQSTEKERKNEIWGAIAAGINAAAMAGAGLYAASNGVSYEQNYWDSIGIISEGLIEAFEKDAYYFKFKYTRNQEIESDIIAYRFCEAMGISGYAYIMALQLLGDSDVYLRASSTSDHPTTAYRILLLKYLFEKDHPKDL